MEISRQEDMEYQSETINLQFLADLLTVLYAQVYVSFVTIMFIPRGNRIRNLYSTI